MLTLSLSFVSSAECKSDADCPYDKACYNENCFNPCTHGPTQCGRDAECLAQNHRATCICPAGTQGNPLIACVRGHCQYNEDCQDHEACDRLNRVCRPVCDADSCGSHAHCEGRNHQPVCNCQPGLSGNPYVECSRQIEQPECTSDSSCPPQLTCVNRRCENPCSRSDVCDVQQTCTVLDTTPTRTVVCKCPPDTITDGQGRCQPIPQADVGCRSNTDCADSFKCIVGSCVLACSVDRCGINALCVSREHRGQCSCPTGYTGNALIECSPGMNQLRLAFLFFFFNLNFSAVPRHPVAVTPAECYTDSDCANDRMCRNERCINPCVNPNPCGHGAFCYAENHQPICKCPSGYTGSPLISCIPCKYKTDTLRTCPNFLKFNIFRFFMFCSCRCADGGM